MSLPQLTGNGYRPEYTTGQVAKMLHVAPRTVTKWIDAGELAGHKLPLSNDRRIPRMALQRFVRKYHFAMPKALRDFSALLASDDGRLIQTLQQEFGDNMHVAQTPFLAGRLYEQVHPTVLIADTRLGAAAARDLFNDVVEEDVLRIAIVGEDAVSPPSDEIEVYRRPFDVTLLVERVRSILNDTHIGG